MHSFEILYVSKEVNIGGGKKGRGKISEVPKEEKFAKRLFKDSTRIGGRGMFKIKDDFYHLDIN